MKIKVEAYIDFEVDKDELPKDMTIVDVMNTVREDVVEVLKDNYRTEKIKVIAEISEEPSNVLAWMKKVTIVEWSVQGVTENYNSQFKNIVQQLQK